MIHEEALVKSIQNNLVEVEIIRSKPCGLCGQTQGCGNGIWGKIFTQKKGSLLFKNTINAAEGDHVLLAIEENYLLKTALIIYGVPLFALFFGMIATDMIATHSTDLKSFIGGSIGFLLGIIIVKYISIKNHYHLYQDAILMKTSNV